MENDERLLEQFFAENRQEIADNGFTRRVMRSLPGRKYRIAQWWTAACSLLALALFVAMDGIGLIWNALRQMLEAAMQSGAAEQMDPKSLAVAGIVLFYLGCRKISSLA